MIFVDLLWGAFGELLKKFWVEDWSVSWAGEGGSWGWMEVGRGKERVGFVVLWVEVV